MGRRGKISAAPLPSAKFSQLPVNSKHAVLSAKTNINEEDADLERALMLSLQENGYANHEHATSSSTSGTAAFSSTLTDDEHLARLLQAQFEEEDRVARQREADRQKADESFASALAGADQLRAAAQSEQSERRTQITNRHAYQTKKFEADGIVANSQAGSSSSFSSNKRNNTTVSGSRPQNESSTSNHGTILKNFTNRPIYDNVYIAESRRQRKLMDLGGDSGQVLLPEDTDVRYEQNYTQWTLPPPHESIPHIDLIKISELEDEVPRKIFTECGVESLNPVQSTVFPVAWGKPYENLLVCAPTGAGKTNIALTCIARVLHDHQTTLKKSTTGNSTQNRFKIVYLAPMKALTHEICSKFRQALKPYNCNVKEMTGDTQLTQKEKITTNVIVATPEKWDVIMRQGSSSLLDELKLLIIDEIHLINEDRGPVLETLIARTVRQIEVEQRIVRMVGLSATLPNYDDVATFLRVNLNVGLFFFDDRFRPVPLTQSFVGIVKNKVEYPTTSGGDKRDASEAQKMDVLFDVLCEQLEAGRQVLIFVHSRRGTAQTARALLQFAADRGKTELFQSPILLNDAAFKHTLACQAHGASAMSHLKRQFEQIEDRDLQEFMRGGLGGIIIHHAGMRKEDRRIVERGYLMGAFPVLVSTATLAWGVNLPADTIIIYGTKVYDQRSGKYTDIDALDIQQMFGRAGRPQFRAQGYGIIITPVEDVGRFMRMLNNEQQIESRLAEHLSDHLNAEIALNNITSVGEAIAWLKETYMYLHMLRNPMQYGISEVGRMQGNSILYDEAALTSAIQERLEDIVRDSAVKLQNAGMIKFMAHTGALKPTIIGKIASRFYVSTETMQQFFKLNNASDVEKVLNLVCGASEFARMIERPDEVEELDYMLERQTKWRVPGTESAFQRKTNILLQAYFNGYYPKNSSTLLMDQRYAVEEAPRLARAIMSMGLATNAPWLMLNGYTLACMIEHAQWPEAFPLLQMRDTSIQFYSQQKIRRDVAQNLMRHREAHNIDQLRELDVNTIAAMAKCQHQEAKMVLDFARRFPLVEVDTQASHIRPVTCTAGRLELHLVPKFLFDPKFHGGRRPSEMGGGGKKLPPVSTNLKFHIMIVCGDEADAIIVAHQEWTMTTADIDSRTSEPFRHKLELFVPIAEQAARSVVSYMVYVFADTWLVPQWYLGEPINFDRRNIPAEDRTVDLHPLLSPMSVRACDEMPLPDLAARIMQRPSSSTTTPTTTKSLNSDKQHEYNMTLYYERLYAHKAMLRNPGEFFGGFDFFNAVQSHTFHAAYHTNTSIFLGAPTGSGKTTIAELCMLRLFQLDAQAKCVYIAPLKALVRERMNDWAPKFQKHLGFRVVELTGESQPDARAVREAHIIVTTPEKWDGISRHWQSRQYVRKVKLVVIDEIHMIGQDRGPVLEVIVARIRSMNNQMMMTTASNGDEGEKRASGSVAASSLNLADNIRIVGLSTPLTNARQLALWLGCREEGIFNISSAYRPVRLEIHIDGFAQRAYCPRMNEMNIPTYRAIVEYGSGKPVLIFVASRRQTRVTARAMVSNAIIDGVERFRRINGEDELRALRRELTDRDLEQCLQHGVGYHNAGMTRRDREIVEQLFKQQKISILVATATLAWGVNLPAHMVVIKGTEFFDGKTKKYVQFPVTDVIQMTGRAGRPQYDKNALAFVFVQDKLKDFYKTFLHSPFPVESGLAPVFVEHLNAEIVAGTVRSLYHACQYLYSTFLAYRLVSNPKYYGLQTPEDEQREQEEAYENARIAHEESQRQQRLREQRINIPGVTSSSGSGAPSTAAALKMFDRTQNKKIASMQDRIDVYIQKMAYDESNRLIEYGCATMDAQGNLEPTFLGSIASYYYLQPKTVDFFYQNLCGNETTTTGTGNDQQSSESENSLKQLLMLLSDAPEFDQVPVRHNEDNENRNLAEKLNLTGNAAVLRAFDDSHTKALLLLYAHLSGRIDLDPNLLPSSDYKTDLRSVLDQLPRILQALLDITAELGLLHTTLKILLLSQMLVQGMWWTCDPSSQMLGGAVNPLVLSRIRQILYADESNKNASKNVTKNSNFVTDFIYTLRSDAAKAKVITDSLQSMRFLAPQEIESVLEKPLKLPVLQISRIRLTAPAGVLNADDATSTGNSAKNTVFYFDLNFDATAASTPVRLFSATEYTLELWIDRNSVPALNGKNLAQFVSPYYQKIRDESWRVVLGRPNEDELLAMTNYQPKSSNEQMLSLKFTTPSSTNNTSDLIWISLYVLSEQFLGLDLQYDFYISVQELNSSSNVCPFVDEDRVYSARVTTSADLGVAGDDESESTRIDLDKFDRLLAAAEEEKTRKVVELGTARGDETSKSFQQKSLALTSRDLDFEPEICYVKSRYSSKTANFGSLPVSNMGDKKRAEKFGEIWKADPEKLIELRAQDEADVIIEENESLAVEDKAAVKRVLFEPPRPAGLDSIREQLRKQQPEVLMSAPEAAAGGDAEKVAVPWYKVGKPTNAATATAAAANSNNNKAVAAGKNELARGGATQQIEAVIDIDNDNDDVVEMDDSTDNAVQQQEEAGGAWWKRSKK